MGRPLNKKYFGNTDSGIGGRSVESADITGTGSYAGTLPAFTFPGPAITEGVSATGTLHGKALSATVNAAGSGYNYGNVLTVSGGTFLTACTFNVTSLKNVTVAINASGGGALYDVGDKVRFEGSYAGGSWTTPLVVQISTTNGSGIATGITVVTPGVWAGSTAPSTTVGATSTTFDGPVDNNGNGLVLSLSAWGVNAVALATEGDYTVAAANPRATTVTPAGGTGATLNITYGVKNISIDVAGSGYITSQVLTIGFTPAGATATLVLSPQGNTTASILLTASTETSTPYANSDIIKQESTAIYKVQNTGGTAFCALQTSTPDAPGEAIMIATDSDGNTYYVVKLCAHLATITQKTGSNFQFRSMTNPVWTLDDPVENYSVKITNG